MKDHFKKAIRQAAGILAISLLLSLGFNFFYGKGINPFRRTTASSTFLTAFRSIGLEEAQKIVGSGIPMLDARNQEDFFAGHIPGAISLPYYDLGSEADRVLPRLPQRHPILIYCSETSCADAELLAQNLFELGYIELLVFKGGYKAWVAAGLAIEREKP